MYVENARFREAYLKEQSSHLELHLETSELQLNQSIHTLRQDVLFLSSTPPISGIVRAALNHGYDPPNNNSHKVWADRLQQIFSAFSRAHPEYIKLRYIGMADGGREIMRIDNRGSKIEITPPGKLQAKGDRDFFNAATSLHEGQVYLSKFNLSQEHGVIAQPHQPTLRASAPVFTPSGKMFGIVEISMDVDNLLKSTVSDVRGFKTFITNMDGQYLLHPYSKQAFNFDLGSTDNIKADLDFSKVMFDPQAPDHQPLQTAGAKRDSPLFAARRIRFDPRDQSRFLLLMYYLPDNVAAKQIATMPASTIVAGLIVVLLISGIALLVLRRTFAPLEKITGAADKIASGKHCIQLPQYGGGEIGSLTTALNSMLVQLSQREKSLLESESRYRRLLESMMDAYVVMDMSGRLLEFNPSFREMLGYSAEELQRLTNVDLTPEKWHGFEARIVKEQIIPDGYSQVYEKEYIRKDGVIFPVELRNFLLRDANNHPEALWAIARDITERKRLGFQLEQLSFAVNRMNEAVFLMDEKGCFQYVNDEACRTLGYTREELIGKASMRDIEQGWTDEMWAEHWHDVKSNGCCTIEAASITKEGHTFPIEVNANYFDYDGRSYIMSIVRDISERKLAEELLRKSSEEIEDLYNNAPCGYHSLDKDGNIRQMNETELVWLGYTRDEVVGKMKWIDLIAPASKNTFQKDYQQLMKQGFIHDMEIEINRKDGTAFNGLINATAIYEPGGDYVMSRATVTDITRRKLVEGQLHDLSAHLQTIREEEKANIAREIHDELGGTLTALKIEAYRLTSELSADNAVSPLLLRVNSMSELLDSAVGATRSIITDLRPTILDDLGLLAALEWQAEQFHKHSGISCRVNCVEDTCNLDNHSAITLFRIFQETLTNIARHSGASRVEVEFQCNNEEVTMSVSDNGRGLPDGYTAAPTSYGMRGMSERVKQLGGNIKFNSPPGGGLNITVVLPLFDKKIKEKRHDPYHDRRRPRHSA